MEKIRVLIAEDFEPIRERYVHMLEKDPDIEVVATVENGKDAVLQTKSLHPDVILMDIEMETKDAGLRAARNILEEFPSMPIIILTVYEEDELVFSAFQLGACDYMLKNTGAEEVIDGVKAAWRHQSPIRPEIAGKIRSEFRRVKQYESSFLYLLNTLSNLTTTELDILDLLAQGKSRSEICRIRFVEMSTVKSQIHGILQKFGRSSIREVLAQIDDPKLLAMMVESRRKMTGHATEPNHAKT